MLIIFCSSQLISFIYVKDILMFEVEFERESCDTAVQMDNFREMESVTLRNAL